MPTVLLISFESLVRTRSVMRVGSRDDISGFLRNRQVRKHSPSHNEFLATSRGYKESPPAEEILLLSAL